MNFWLILFYFMTCDQINHLTSRLTSQACGAIHLLSSTEVNVTKLTRAGACEEMVALIEAHSNATDDALKLVSIFTI
jgi:hypothetical protein